MPERIQRRRTKGWRMPEGAICVDRSTKWGNPYTITDPLLPYGLTTQEKRQAIVDEYRLWLRNTVRGREIYVSACEMLRGKNLACWCPLDQPCHADVLLEIANA